MGKDTATSDRPHPGQGLAACEELLRPLVLARNASAARRMAERYGVPPDELAAYLRRVLAEEKQEGNPERLGPRFDIHHGEYSTLEEWVEGFVKAL
jgi:hypothetical protein